MTDWYLGCESSNWSENCFNAIIELRLRREQNGVTVPDSAYIIQLEFLQSQVGVHKTPNYSTAGTCKYPNGTTKNVSWTTGEGLDTYGSTPVYKFVVQDCSVTGNTWRYFKGINLAQFMQHTAAWPSIYKRASTSARLYEIHAGVEFNRGSGKVWVGDYNCTVSP